MMVSAHDVARELRKRLPGLGDVKLHKLLYYCQGWHLVWTEEPMFTEPVEAWDMGPVVGDLWHAESKGRATPLIQPLDAIASATLGYVVARYGGLSGRDLIHLTHGERPWLDASEIPLANSIIALDAMRGFFIEDEDVAPSMRLAAAAWADPETRRHLEEAARRTEAATPVRDDREEIHRRLEALA